MSLTRDTYMTTLAGASAVLAVKIGILHLASARSRLMTGFVAQDYDKKNALAPMLKAVLLGYWTDFGGIQFVNRIERITKNCAENEPFFLALATLGGLSNAVPVATGVTLIKTYTLSRCTFTALYLAGEKINTAYRSVAFVSGLFTTFGMAVLASGLAKRKE
jgi:uncharacterized MAPEG superfamily protein